MAQTGTSGGSNPLADPARDVQVTIIRSPDGRAARTRFIDARAGARVVGALLVVIAAAAAVAAGGLQRASVQAPVVASSAQPGGSSGAAATYRYPLGCLGASISGRASPIRSRGPCWRYGVYVTATFRQVRGVWRLALEAVSPSCPSISLPEAVRAQLATCLRRTPAREGR
jgi:hypothetical protein